ncbi:hypothetical protein [Butyrivibrio sp. XPD2006]|uniref:hypothetical protein n=1 Tax=Butyrivibrio sp. XPD2006 TaxID=1280668 RepID=UPI0012DC110A|nr:hypothetical protein [Butyrivibrio sp. XPD2006]
MKRSVKRAIIGIIIFNCILIVAAICGKILSRFDYEDHLDDVVITVDDTDITLREFGYYIYEIEVFVQKQALLYDPENPKHWWNTHFSAGMDSQFVCDYAKKVAINTCISEEIYYKKALSDGIILSSIEEEQALTEAKLLYGSMTEEQLTRTGLNEDIIVKMRVKHALATKYAGFLADSQDFSKYSEEPEKLVNWDGAYYQEEILPKHTVVTNKKVLDKITLGKITVNYQ